MTETTTSPELLRYSEQTFWSTFQPQNGPTETSGPHIWEFDEVRHRDARHVWTIVETGDDENGNWYAIPGFHIVNKIGYAVTKVAWPHENIEAVWFEDDFDHSNDIDLDDGLDLDGYDEDGE